MKGAMGNALLLNIVITFILIFFSLLIGSMAYSKAYKIKNYLVSSVDYFVDNGRFSGNFASDKNAWENHVNPYLAKIGYNLSGSATSCPTKDGYSIYKNTSVGDYEYCIYQKVYNYSSDSLLSVSKTYMVLVYMKLDFPVIGNYIKMPVTGETKTYTSFK